MTLLTLGIAPPAPTAEGFGAVRAHTEALAAPLSPEDQTVQSMPDVSPTKWHRAHTTWFFETFVLAEHAPDYTAHDPHYRYLFNSYYEAVGTRHPRPERGLVSRPGVREIDAYRRAVDVAMADLLDADDGDLPEHVLALVELGLHHEQQHQELLLMDIKHVLSCNPLQPAYDPGWTPASSPVRAGGGAAPLGWVEHDGGLVRVGHDAAAGGFAFDNESPAHDVHLRPFALADRPVTCGDWEDFVDDGGYRRPDLWLSDGWAAVNTLGWDAPLYWSPADATVFTLAGPRPLDPADAVCHVSYYEADAYARWAGARLPTEAEWETLAPRHVGRTGEVWEWTASAYLPYPGFRPAAGAVGEYNGKFMVGQHVLRGGCAVTPPGHVRPTYRNFFPPGARWPFTGLRLARDL